MKHAALILLALTTALAQPKPEDTELYSPEPKLITPGATDSAPPSDAIILFNGANLDQWVNTRDKSPAAWTVANGILTVNKAAGNIETKRAFRNYQLHLEWRIPAEVTGSGQSRGNSGLSSPPRDPATPATNSKSSTPTTTPPTSTDKPPASTNSPSPS